jgi:site-specific recombinase XerD
MSSAAPLALLSQPTRTEQQLRGFRAALTTDADRVRSRAYVDGLDAWLASIRSPHTKRFYTYSLLEFVDWYERQYRKVPLPHEVRRAEAAAFATWLSERDRGRDPGVDAERLRKVDRKLDLAIYKSLQQSPGMDIDQIRSRVAATPGIGTTILSGRTRLGIEKDDPDYALDKHLSCLVERKLLAREPSIEDIRTARVTVAFTAEHARRLAAELTASTGGDVSAIAAEMSSRPLSPAEAKRVGIDFRADPKWFRYTVDRHTESQPVDRAGTVASRIAAISSFWSFLIQRGENYEGYQAPMRVNIWLDLQRQFAPRAREQKRRSRIEKATDMTTFARLLSTTTTSSLEDVRDRAALMMFFWTFVRAEELGKLKRGDVLWSSDPDRPPMVRVTGKGRKVREFQIPAGAYQALVALSFKLNELAEVAERRNPDVTARARVLLQPGAPLIPSLVRWGCDSAARGVADEDEAESLRQEDALRGLTRQGFSALLWRRAALAEIQPGTPEYKRVHPHGLRHLGIRQAIKRGVPLPWIKHAAGHGSLAVTDVYTEEYDESAVSLEGTTPAAAPREVAPAEAPAWAGRPVIETVGTTVEEEPPHVVSLDRQAPPPDVEATVEVARSDVPAPGTPPGRGISGVARVAAVEIAEARAPAARPGEGLQQIGTTGPLPQSAKPPDWAYTKEQEANKLVAKARWKGDPLVNVYEGAVSQLVWWYGPTGKLTPRMPVISFDQAAGTAADAGDVQGGIGQLWMRWMWSTSGTKGPMAAAALVQWLGVGLDITAVTDEFGATPPRSRRWMPFTAAVGDRSLADDHTYSEFDFRAHRADRIVAWYSDNAGEFFQSKTGVPVDDPREAGKLKPAWFFDHDPILSLPEDERDDLLLWLEELTGARSRPGAEPGEGEFGAEDFDTLVTYVTQYSSLADTYKRTRSATAAKQMDAIRPFLKDAVDKMTGGMVPDFDRQLDRLEADRQSQAVQARAGYAGTGGIKSSEAWWRKRLKEMSLAAGAEAAVSAKPPLDTDEYREMFRVDSKKHTIVHTPEFAKAFTATTGAHSECVARRMARLLWELRREGSVTLKSENRQRLITLLAAATYYMAPCAHELEAELRVRAGEPKKPDPTDREFDDAAARMEDWRQAIADAGADLDVLQARVEMQRQQAAGKAHYGLEQARARAQGYRQNPAAVMFVLNPVTMLFVATAPGER